MLCKLKLFGSVFLLCCLNSCCSSKSEDGTNFMVIGDWGGLPDYPYRTAIEKQVANSLGKVAEDKTSEFQIALGDNFYFDGVKDVNDKRFEETFESVFTADSLNTPWYMIAGNHDWNGNVSAEIAYSQVSERWNFPNFYYPLSFMTPDGASIDIFLIDTIMFCGNLDSDFSSAPLDGPLDPKASDDQLAWLGVKLATSKADYILVGGHYPVYSMAEHGPTDCLIEKIKPMLVKYNVTAYICGHDHNLQHIREDLGNNDMMDYFVIGSANFADNSTKHSVNIPKGSLRYHYAESSGGFAHFFVNKQSLNVTLLSGSDKELYHTSIVPRFGSDY